MFIYTHLKKYNNDLNMLIAEYSKRRKLDGFNLFVRVSEQDANINHYNNIFVKAFTDKYFTFNVNDNEFMFYEMHGNLLYKYLYILNKFVLKCDNAEMTKYKQEMKALCQKRLIKVDYRIFTRNSFTEDYTEDDIPQEIIDEFSYLFTRIKHSEVQEEEEEEENDDCETETPGEQLEVEKIETLRTELETSKKELEALKKELETSKKELETSKKELETSKKELEAEQIELDALKKELEAEKIELDALKKELEADDDDNNDDAAKYNEMQREIDMLRQKLEFYNNSNISSSENADLIEQNTELQNEYNNLLSEFEEYRESTEKQIEELKQYEPVDLSLYTKSDTTEIASLLKEFEERIEKLIVNNKDASVDVHRLRNTVTSLEMENTELRKENEEIYEKLAYCEKQFELIKQKYVKLQQLKHKYKTMVINSSSVNHIEELPFVSKKLFSPIPDEPVRYPYKMN